MRPLVAKLVAFMPLLTRTLLLPECGHWIRQERPAELNGAMIAFLGGL